MHVKCLFFHERILHQGGSQMPLTVKTFLQKPNYLNLFLTPKKFEILGKRPTPLSRQLEGESEWKSLIDLSNYRPNLYTFLQSLIFA